MNKNKIFLSILFGVLFLFGVCNSVFANTLSDNSSKWTKKQEIQINSSKILGDNDLLFFPILITEQNIDQSIFVDAQDDGCDIRFSSSGEKLNPHEIPFEKVYFSRSSNKAEFWVKTNLLVNTTNSIWIWWGNSSVNCYANDEKYGAYNTWNDSYKAVWHFNENSGTRYDSTINNNNLTDNNTVKIQNGKWSGNSADFELDDSEYLEIKNSDQTDLNFGNQFTVSAWIKPESLNISQVVYERGGVKTIDLQHRILIHSDNDFSVGYRGGNYAITTNQPISSEWQFVVGKIKSNFQETLRNGSVSATSTYIVNPRYGDYDLGVGRRYFTGMPNYFDGLIDELRMSVDYLSNDWIKTEYNNQNDPASFAVGQQVEYIETIIPTILIPGIMGSWMNGENGVLDPILHTYDNLWQAFQQAGYEEGVDLFAFPYEWRNPNTYTAELLKNKIEEIKADCGCDKVNIVAHSMGGLVARSYIEGAGYANDVDQLIFLGTPHQGAPSAYLTWEGAEFGNSLFDNLKERIFELEAFERSYYVKNKLFNYIRSMESVRELLPVYDYLIDNGSPAMRVYPDSYPENVFLEILNSPSALAKLGSVDITNIVADDGNDTLDTIIVEDGNYLPKWEHGVPVNYYSSQTGLLKSDGDGTVPADSNRDFIGEDIIVNSNHREMVTDAQADVLHELTGEDYGVMYDERINSTLLIRVMSPVDFVITNPEGQKLGKDFENLENINEINKAFYTGFETDVEFATIVNPVDGEYSIDLEGIDNGEYRLAISYLTEDGGIDREFVGFVREEQVVNFFVDFDEEDNDFVLLNAFEKTLGDLEELNNSSEINKKHVYKFIKKKIERLNNKYLKIQNENRDWKRYLINRYIVFHLKILKSHLNFYINKNWISQAAYDILENDIKNLINML